MVIKVSLDKIVKQNYVRQTNTTAGEDMPKPTFIGRPNVLVVGGGNVPWSAPAERSQEDRLYERPLHHLRTDARKCRKLLAANDNKPTSAHAIYVCSDLLGNVSKIGVAHSPADRLSRIQTGNPEELFLHRVFWVDDENSALLVERRAHSLASAHGRLMGEWFACRVHEAHNAIAKAIDELNIDYVVITPTTSGKEA